MSFMKCVNKANNHRYTPYVMYYAISIALCPFFSQYDFFIEGISFADIMLVSSCVPLILMGGIIKTKHTGIIVVYYCVSLFTTLLVVLAGQDLSPLISFGELTTRWIRYAVYACLILLVSDNSAVNKEDNMVLRIYRLFCYAFGIYAIVQAIVFLIFHYMLPLNILPISWSRATSAETITSFVENYYFRGFGPFMEPSYLSKFLLPGLALSLWGWEKKKLKNGDMRLAIIITVAIALSTSVQGILVAVATYIVYFLRLKQKSTKKIIAIILVAIFVGVLLTTTNVLMVPLQRIDAVFTGKDYGYSSNLRLYRGFAFWYEMPFIYKIIGTGLGNMGNFANTFEIYTKFDFPRRSINYLEYGSGISLVLVQSGLIGLGIFVWWVIKSIKSLNSLGKMLFIQFILVLFSGSGLFSVTSIFYCAMIFYNIKSYEVTNEQNSQGVSSNLANSYITEGNIR